MNVLVNNAAHGTRDGFDSLDGQGLDAHYFVNVRATALLSVGFAKRFSDGAGGRIVNLTSGQDLGPMPRGCGQTSRIPRKQSGRMDKRSSDSLARKIRLNFGICCWSFWFSGPGLGRFSEDDTLILRSSKYGSYRPDPEGG